ncbi:MAG TPA: tRNA (cytidine(34)-2'-O)-methyltransferase [Elusimicrobiota bacterium]|nr:tRNA (cytidine(34)-2'-O)-methyltransferase [Elusimicrobiota bacterium]
MDVVLYEPDIPWNTGNIGRTCVATGSPLHLVGRLGFTIDAAEVRRSGLDYWEKLNLIRHDHWQAFEKSLHPQADLYFFSKRADREFWDAKFVSDGYLIFGCETGGLPEFIHRQYAERLYRIPMLPQSVRSLNLSTSVGIALYEALRQTSAHRIPSHARLSAQTA